MAGCPTKLFFRFCVVCCITTPYILFIENSTILFNLQIREIVKIVHHNHKCSEQYIVSSTIAHLCRSNEMNKYMPTSCLHSPHYAHTLIFFVSFLKMSSLLLNIMQNLKKYL